jgi:3-hydroxyacyl-[acyl-carrier-protein] dehydratase
MSHAQLDSAELHALLAHRFPFLLVDRVRVIEPGRQVLGIKRVTSGEWWCNPAEPAVAEMPFTLVIEAMAQTTGALLRDLVDRSTGALAYFMGANRVRFRRPARAGDMLELAVTLRQWRRGICRTFGVATVGGELVASADLTTIVRAPQGGS